MRGYGRILSPWWIVGKGRKLRGDPTAIAVACYLRTCAEGNLIGLFYLPFPTIAHYLGISTGELEAALVKLAAVDEAHVDRDADLVWIPDLAGEELGTRPLSEADNRRKSVIGALETFGDTPFKGQFLARYGALVGLDAPLPRGGDTRPLPFEGEAVPPSKGGDTRPLPFEGDAGPPSKGVDTPSPGSSPIPAIPPSEPRSGSGSGSDPGSGTESSRGQGPERAADEPQGSAPSSEEMQLWKLAVDRPGDPMIRDLVALVAKGHEWAIKCARRFLDRSPPRFTDKERARLTEITAEQITPVGQPKPRNWLEALNGEGPARVWAEYRAAMMLRGREVRDAPSPQELAAADYTAREAAEAAKEENSRADRSPKAPSWTARAVEADWIARHCDSTNDRVTSDGWPLPMIKTSLSRFGLKGRKPPQTAVEKLSEKEAQKAARKAAPDLPPPRPSSTGPRTGTIPRIGPPPPAGSDEEADEMREAREELDRAQRYGNDPLGLGNIGLGGRRASA